MRLGFFVQLFIWFTLVFVIVAMIVLSIRMVVIKDKRYQIEGSN